MGGPGDALRHGLRDHGVTAREAEVLDALSERLTNAEIGTRLSISVRTVETHVSSLLAKLGVRNRAELAALGPVGDSRWARSLDLARLRVDRSSGFIGRAAEREVLLRAWKQAEQGSPQVAFVAGEPGIGKTRLASEIALHVHDHGGLVLLGSCDEELAVPYQPFVEALRPVVSSRPEQGPADAPSEWAGELARLFPELPHSTAGVQTPQSADPGTERYLLFSAVTHLLSVTSRRRPVLLVLDDLHWATKPTLLLLKHLIHSGEPMSLLLIGTYRDADIGRGHPLTDLLAELRRESGVQRIGLRGLSDDEAVTMMETLAGHDLSDSELELAHAVHAEATGNPFFIRELLHHLLEAGELVQQEEGWAYRGELSTLGVPESVREVIGHRLSRLPEPVERLLTLSAVIGHQFDLAVLAPLAGLERSAILEALETARKAALIREVPDSPGRYAFVHSLIRHTLYDELGSARRMELHRSVAATLESLDQAETFLTDLARHWVAATPAVRVDPEDLAKTAGYAARAGRRAMASLAYEEAADHFRGALGAARQAGDENEHCELLIALGEAQRCAGDAGHRETLLEAGRLAHGLGDPDRAARAALANQRGGFSRVGAVDRERVSALERALEIDGRTEGPTRARLLAALATELHFEGEQRRLEAARKALRIARNGNDPEALAQALAALWFAAWGTAAQSERASIAAELSGVAGQLGDRMLQFQAAAALFLAAGGEGDMAQADEGLAECRRLAHQLGQPALRWRVAYLEAHRASAAGRFDEAEHWARESMRLGELAGQPDSVPFASGALTIVRLLQGRPEEVEALLAPVIEEVPGAVIFPAILAWALAEEGQREKAQAIVDRLRPEAFAGVPPDYLRPAVLCCLAKACAGLGDAAAAAELSDLLLPSRAALVTGQTVWIGPVTHDLGLLATTLGRYDEADGHFAEAAAVQDRIGASGTLVHTRLEWARMLLLRAGPDDRARAGSLLTEAKTGARALRLPIIERRIDLLLAKVSA